MNGKHIPDEQVKELLELGIWAPTHGRTEPWRFFVYTGEAINKFAADHAKLYWDNTPEEKRSEDIFGKMHHSYDNVSHVVIAVMKRDPAEKFNIIEEISAAAAATQNILLGATALGIASFWSTGGLTHHTALKHYLGLAEHDHVLGLIYLGYSDEPAKEGKRNSSVEDKSVWNG